VELLSVAERPGGGEDVGVVGRGELVEARFGVLEASEEGEDRGQAVDVVVVPVGGDDVGDGATGERRFEQSRVAILALARVDQDDLFTIGSADEVGVGALLGLSGVSSARPRSHTCSVNGPGFCPRTRVTKGEICG
jgi:hypothetical protein